jgi:hypothetical protein
MTSLDLGCQFDRVLVHDAIMYATEPHAVRVAVRHRSSTHLPLDVILLAMLWLSSNDQHNSTFVRSIQVEILTLLSESDEIDVTVFGLQKQLYLQFVQPLDGHQLTKFRRDVGGAVRRTCVQL